MKTFQILRKRTQPSKTDAMNTAKVTIWIILQTRYIMLYSLQCWYSRFGVTCHDSLHRVLFFVCM